MPHAVAAARAPSSAAAPTGVGRPSQIEHTTADGTNSAATSRAGRTWRCTASEDSASRPATVPDVENAPNRTQTSATPNGQRRRHHSADAGQRAAADIDDDLGRRERFDPGAQGRADEQGSEPRRRRGTRAHRPAGHDGSADRSSSVGSDRLVPTAMPGSPARPTIGATGSWPQRKGGCSAGTPTKVHVGATKVGTFRLRWPSWRWPSVAVRPMRQNHLQPPSLSHDQINCGDQTAPG